MLIVRIVRRDLDEVVVSGPYLCVPQNIFYEMRRVLCQQYFVPLLKNL